MIALLTVYFYQGISRLGTQTNKVIKLMAESSRPLLKRLAERGDLVRYSGFHFTRALWPSPGTDFISAFNDLKGTEI